VIHVDIQAGGSQPSTQLPTCCSVAGDRPPASARARWRAVRRDGSRLPVVAELGVVIAQSVRKFGNVLTM
jgi:hypothetical protein